jgi:hypothetical protein
MYKCFLKFLFVELSVRMLVVVGYGHKKSCLLRAAFSVNFEELYTMNN